MKESSKQKKQSIFEKYRTIIILSIIVIFIFAAIFIIKSIYGPSSQIDQLRKDIDKHHYRSIANTLNSSENDRKMTQQEAKHLAKYFDDKKHKRQLKIDTENIKSNIKKDNAESNLGSIKNDDNEPIISFSRNGKKFIFIDKAAPKLHYKKVYVKELNNPATYEFNDHKKLITKGKGISYLGSFVNGNYSEYVKKSFKNKPVRGSVEGKIHINTSKKDKSNRIIADQFFNQTKIKVNLHNNNHFKQKDVQIYINNNPIDESTDKVLGYYPNNYPIKVVANGTLKEHTFTTNTKHVMQNIDNNTQVVDLKFDEKEIKKTLNKDTSEKKEAGKFIKEYMKHLNDAYKEKSYAPISSDIESGSDAEDFMKPKFNDKKDIKYTKVNVLSVKKSGSNFDVLISKNFKNNKITTLYNITKSNNKFKINNIADQ